PGPLQRGRLGRCRVRAFLGAPEPPAGLAELDEVGQSDLLDSPPHILGEPAPIQDLVPSSPLAEDAGGGRAGEVDRPREQAGQRAQFLDGRTRRPGVVRLVVLHGAIGSQSVVVSGTFATHPNGSAPHPASPLFRLRGRGTGLSSDGGGGSACRPAAVMTTAINSGPASRRTRPSASSRWTARLSAAMALR